MPTSIYTNQDIPSGKWCITIITFPGPSASGGEYSGASFAGHAHLAFEWRRNDTDTRHVVFHLVGARRESFSGAHTIYNTASVERFVPNEQGMAVSSGGSSHRQLDQSNASDTSRQWYGDKKISHASILVESSKGLRAFGLCKQLSCGVSGERKINVKHEHFSLIGANIGIGTNCITFCQQILKDIGVEMNWSMYLLSFASSNIAMRVGGLYERA